MPLTGTLRDLSLAALVQLQCGERQRARVTLLAGSLEGQLVFAEGELVFAQVGVLAGEEAVHELLTWDDAEFRVEHDAGPLERNVQAPWPALLLDGARRMDEARAQRDARAESLLHGLRGRHGLRTAVLLSPEGRVRASAAEGPVVAEAARLAFLVGRLEAAGAALNCGALVEAQLAAPAEKLWIGRRDGSYLACWLDGRASTSGIVAHLRPLLAEGGAVATG